MQTRRNFLKLGMLGSAMAFSCGVTNVVQAGHPAPVLSAKPARKPNFVFILCDDLGYGDLSATGQKKFQTPNIDSLARDGMRFNQFYSGCPLCAPSRCSLMTGLTIGHTWVRSNEPYKATTWESGKQYLGKLVPLRQNEITLPRTLKALGYATGMFGKWGLGNLGTTGEPIRQGFDECFGYLDQVHAHHYYTDHLVENDKDIPIDKTQYSHDLIWNRGMDFVRKHKDEPFFLYLPTTIPHASIEVPEDSMKPFIGKFEEKPHPQAWYSKQDTPAAAFAGMVTRLDRDVGRLLDLLKELRLDENTIVFFTSDNGPHREGGHRPVYFDSAGPFRGFKTDLYEGGIHVPMFVRWPGTIQAGTASEEVYAFWDIFPTLSSLAGVPKDALPKCDGISMEPALKGKHNRHNKERVMYWESYHGQTGFIQAVRMGRWKGIRLKLKPELELYDLENDIAETKNVAAEHPAIVRKIEQIMVESRTESTIWKSGLDPKTNLPMEKNNSK